MNPSESEEEKGKLKSFLKWAAGLGISDSENPLDSSKSSSLAHSLTVSYFPDAGGRGLAALRPISRGDLLLKVPKSSLITSHSLLSQHQTLSLFLNLKSHHSLSPSQLFTVCLLYEISKGKASPWHPYFLHLPRSYSILAAFGEFEKQALQVDYAIWAADKAVSKAEYEWKQASPLLNQLKLKPPLLAFRAWVWATATISSRTLHIPWDEAGCLCPVGDLFNYAAPGEDPHHSERLTDAAYEEDAAAYCFYAKKDYKMGEQVLLSYGTYTNLELLEHYGFLLEDNPNEKVFISLEPDIYCFSSWPKESLYIHHNGRPSFALMSALRLWATPAYQRKSIGHLVYSGYQLSQGNEISVMKWLAEKCHSILKDMPTSIEEDKSLLSFIEKIQDFDNLGEWGKTATAFGGEFCNFLKASGLKRDDELISAGRTKMLADRWQLAVQWRLIYKKVIVDCISHCTEIIDSLSS
ncbi:hypothetical protein REPUB_Repub12eG0002300 [Reevesia pubescens]